MKNCSKCLQDKLLVEFYKNAAYVGGYVHTCKLCFRARNKKYKKSHTQKVKEMNSTWKIANRQKVNSEQREWRKTHPMSLEQTIALYLRTRLNTAIKGNFKGGSAVRDLGCSISQFKQHIESKFKPGMSWNNWSKDGWHMDHIEPLCKFDLTDPNQVKKVCNYTNIQPLWALDNLIKGGK